MTAIPAGTDVARGVDVAANISTRQAETHGNAENSRMFTRLGRSAIPVKSKNPNHGLQAER
jgi:hypothetical protein